ncbi:MAG: NAD(P)-dependent oxidoreductase [Gemmatimonadetes bacterium]|nr:NAD(P)-dependent oxidoreductase [Gemmatimonadota bacterium]MBI2615667.1 NAD(P)-dependent oxidoreductase [Gemmatimonadota bacterium]
MRVFVTGATGFVGSHLVDALLHGGHQVVCLVRDPAKATRVLGGRPVQMVAGDLFTVEALEQGCRGADVVVHVAGLIAARSRQEFHAVNGGATARLVETARRVAPALRRFVYLSSLSAAGPTRRGHPRSESDPPHPVSEYGRSKLAGEEAVRAGGVPWTIVRPPTVYGPRDRETLRAFRFARLGVIPGYARPDQELSFIHVEDLARAIIAATAPACEGRIYFACHPEIATWRAAMAAIFTSARAALGRPLRPPRFVPIPPLLTRSILWVLGTAAHAVGRATILAPDKAAELLAEAWTCTPAALIRDAGWRAAIDLHAGLPGTAQWYASHGWL